MSAQTTQPAVAPYPPLARRILANAEALFRKKGAFVLMGMKNGQESWIIHFPGFHKQPSEDFKAEWQLHPVRFRRPAVAARRAALVNSQHACTRQTECKKVRIRGQVFNENRW